MGNVMRILSFIGCSVLLCFLFTSCSKTVYHPDVYDRIGRPAWTYDENRIEEDTKHDEFLMAELENPKDYYYFLGIQTELVKTEENARLGAYSDALNHFRMFLETKANTELRDRRGEFPERTVKAEFQIFTDAWAHQLKPVRWCLEEKISEFILPPSYSRWRAWCLTAISKARCDDLYNEMMSASMRKSGNGLKTQKGAISFKESDLKAESGSVDDKFHVANTADPNFSNVGLNEPSTSFDPGNGPEWRTWTISEMVKIEAKFLEFNGYLITLRRKDGRRIKLHIDKLSEEDQTYLLDVKGIDSDKINHNRKSYTNVSL